MACQSYNIEKVNFLIVEDNAHMRLMVRSILSALGAHSIKDAENAKSAFEILGAFPIDIVICDWQMKPVNGLDFVRAIRTGKNSPNPLIPIIMLTAHSEMKRVTEARDCGVNEFAVKPVSAKSLYAKIREIIRNPRNFVQTETYFGPDRRRRQVKFDGEERRKDVPTAAVSDAEIKALLND